MKRTSEKDDALNYEALHDYIARTESEVCKQILKHIIKLRIKTIP